MSVTISGGGSGGGITIETDPTALKLVGGTLTGNLEVNGNNGIDFIRLDTNYNNEGFHAISIGSASAFLRLDSAGIIFQDGTAQTTAYTGGGGGAGIPAYNNGEIYQTDAQVLFADKFYRFNSYIGAAGYAPDSHPEAWTEISAGGGSWNGGQVTSLIDVNGGYAGKVYIDPNFEGSARVYVADEYDTTRTTITPSGIQFTDGSVQTTAYTGGGGGGNGTSVQQRYADAIAALTATPQVGVEFGDTMISVQWAVAFQMNNNSLYYEYPKFLDAMQSGTNAYSVAIYANGYFFPVTYIDAVYIIGLTSGEALVDSYIQIAVTDSVNGGGFPDTTTTALSFPAGYATNFV